MLSCNQAGKLQCEIGTRAKQAPTVGIKNLFLNKIKLFFNAKK
jgi:hypothetical protein